jgi:hypothetical protein
MVPDDQQPIFRDEVMEELWQVKDELGKDCADMSAFFAKIKELAAHQSTAGNSQPA